MPTTPYLLCDHCRVVLPGAVVNTPEPVACPSCHASLLARVFPAFFHQSPETRAAESVASDEDASCFYHPRKKAVVPCGQCGRFLCALCDLEIDGRHFCPGCVEAGRATRQDGPLLAARTLHDKIALTVAVVPLFPLFFLFTVLTAPTALFLVIRYWNEPRQGPLRQGRGRLITAALLALGQIGFWGFMLYHSFFHLSASI